MVISAFFTSELKKVAGIEGDTQGEYPKAEPLPLLASLASLLVIFSKGLSAMGPSR